MVSIQKEAAAWKTPAFLKSPDRCTCEGAWMEICLMSSDFLCTGPHFACPMHMLLEMIVHAVHAGAAIPIPANVFTLIHRWR